MNIISISKNLPNEMFGDANCLIIQMWLLNGTRRLFSVKLKQFWQKSFNVNKIFGRSSEVAIHGEVLFCEFRT